MSTIISKNGLLNYAFISALKICFLEEYNLILKITSVVLWFVLWFCITLIKILRKKFSNVCPCACQEHEKLFFVMAYFFFLLKGNMENHNIILTVFFFFCLLWLHTSLMSSHIFTTHIFAAHIFAVFVMLSHNFNLYKEQWKNLIYNKVSLKRKLY